MIVIWRNVLSVNIFFFQITMEKNKLVFQAGKGIKKQNKQKRTIDSIPQSRNSRFKLSIAQLKKEERLRDLFHHLSLENFFHFSF